MADRPLANSTSTRSVIQAPYGMVATSQPLAAAAGQNILQKGGNAYDAAVATAATLCVVEPMMTGIGGDVFALMYHAKTKQIEGLNGSGKSPQLATRDYFQSKSYDKIPDTGILTVSTPGTVDGWAEILEKYGTMTFKEVLQPAIDYAENGFPVSEIVSTQWAMFKDLLLKTKDATETFLVDGEVPQVGEVFYQPNLAKTLRLIAENGRDAFYKGEIAEKIDQYMKENDGLLRYDDLANHSSVWVNPLHTDYRGYTVYQLPPNGQGMAVLQMLNILEGYDVASLGHNTAEYLHLLIEAKKLAYADRDQYIADPDMVTCPVDQLLSKEYAEERRRLIDLQQAAKQVDPGLDLSTDTIYLTVVDKDRNVVSLINSICGGFGSGIVAGDTGIILQNRGKSFSLDKDHLNSLEPGKRAFHTIIPSIVCKNDRPYFSFGVMGGDMQPQGQVQVLLNLLEFGMDVQEAGEAPRFRHNQLTNEVALETGISHQAMIELNQLGHKLTLEIDVFGGYQGIRIDPETGMLQGGSDPRKDGAAIGY